MSAHATAAELRAYSPADLTADLLDAELTRILDRASDDVDQAITEEPDLGAPLEVAALNRATMLTAEAILAVGEEAALIGGDVTIGHVQYTMTAGAGGMTRPPVPPSALRVLQHAGLIRNNVVAW